MIRRIKNIIRTFLSTTPKDEVSLKDYSDINESSLVEIYSALRHEVHRIEKAAYNNILFEKKETFDSKVLKAKDIQKTIQEKDPQYLSNPVYTWSNQILESYPQIIENFTNKYSGERKELNIHDKDSFINRLRNRRSCRLWDESDSEINYSSLIDKFIEAAIWAPNSGNRQAVRIRPIYKKEEKDLLIGIKEKHCYTAPLIFYIGIDKRLYGALSTFEECMYLDAGAAITQMILFADSIGLGSCWNHFGVDMIYSRTSNIPIYENFKKQLNLPDYIIPIAILSVGYPSLITPKPERMPKEYFLI